LCLLNGQAILRPTGADAHLIMICLAQRPEGNHLLGLEGAADFDINLDKINKEILIEMPSKQSFNYVPFMNRASSNHQKGLASFDTEDDIYCRWKYFAPYTV